MSSTLIERVGTKKRIHINRHVVRSNLKTGAREPPITIKIGTNLYLAHRVEIRGSSTLVYQPDKPLSCGASVWIETYARVQFDTD